MQWQERKKILFQKEKIGSCQGSEFVISVFEFWKLMTCYHNYCLLRYVLNVLTDNIFVLIFINFHFFVVSLHRNTIYIYEF